MTISVYEDNKRRKKYVISGMQYGNKGR